MTVTADSDDKGDDCADSASVFLDAPLGDRSVVDDATGKTLDLSPD